MEHNPQDIRLIFAYDFAMGNVPKTRVYMHFMLVHGGWYCQFLREDCKTSLPRKLTFADPEKVREMAKRGGAAWTSADRQTMEYAIREGRGGVWLNLTDDQLEKLRLPQDDRASPNHRAG